MRHARTLLVALSSIVLLKNSSNSGRSTSFCAMDKSFALEGLYCAGGADAVSLGRRSFRILWTREDRPASMVRQMLQKTASSDVPIRECGLSGLSGIFTRHVRLLNRLRQVVELLAAQLGVPKVWFLACILDRPS